MLHHDPVIPARKCWRGQFMLTRGTAVQPGAATSYTLGAWRLHAYPGARVRPVCARDGQALGWTIGTLIDHAAGMVLDGPLTLDLPASPSARDEAVEAALYRHGGAFLMILAAPGLERIYLDADGMLPLVYDPGAGRAAATTGLLLDDDVYRARFDHRLYRALGVAGEGWFPAGLTAHRGIRRLLCNHYLDLATFRAVRHWPRSDFSHQGRLEPSVERIGMIVRDTTRALLRSGTVAAALTGGNETRLLLGAYRPLLADMTFATVAGPATRRDVAIACRLASQFGLRHIELPIVEADTEAEAAWLYAAGHCVTGSNMRTHPSTAPLAGFDWFLGGLGGEIGRAFFWRPTDVPDMALEADAIVPRFGMPLADEVIAATREWHQGVRDLNPLTRLDLAYLELRMSAWAAAQAYAQSHVSELHPLICRESYALMLDLPPAAKRGSLLIAAGIRRLWPELAAIPINRYGDYRDVVHGLKRAASPARVAKKLRKLFG